MRFKQRSFYQFLRKGTFHAKVAAAKLIQNFACVYDEEPAPWRAQDANSFLYFLSSSYETILTDIVFIQFNGNRFQPQKV